VRFSITELAARLGGEQVGPDVTVTGASIDTRTVLPGQLYVPIVAERDGHEFISAALESGSPAYLTEREPMGGTAVVVEDTAGSLLRLGLFARERMEGRAAEFAARRQAIGFVIDRLDRLAAEQQIPEEICLRLRAHRREQLSQIELRSVNDVEHKRHVNLFDEIELQLIAAERGFINDLYSRGELKDEARRRIERGLDLREAEIANLHEEGEL